MPPCDVDGCPREGTNELEIQELDVGSGRTGPATALLCDHDFRAAHDAALAFALAVGEPPA